MLKDEMPAGRVPPDAILFVANKKDAKSGFSCGGHLFRGLFM
jgi:hypothetical protein